MSFIISGLIILVSIFSLNLISPYFLEEKNLVSRPVVKFVFIYISACFIYFVYIVRIKKYKPNIKNLLFWIFIVGIIARVIMIFSTPILEVDYHRYLWDGAVTANGYNPYEYSPQEFIKGKSNEKLPERLRELSINNLETLEKINHPQLKSSYPPVTQAVFAFSNLIKPFSLITWKAVLLIVDIITFFLIYLVLKKLKIPQSNLIIYWWNPLLIKEVFNSGHMDVIIFPFLLACFLLYLSKKYLFSFAVLCAAVGVKLWPVLLLPVLLRNFVSDWKKFLKYFSIFSVLTFFILSPLIFSFFDQASGLQAYSRSWQNNDSFFRIILAAAEFVLPLFGYHPGHGQLVSRIAVGLVLIFAIVYLIKNKSDDRLDYFKISLVIISFAFFLSPAQFPWYYLWMLPFLTIIPYKPLLLLTALMPLYYLRYYFEPRGQYEFYYQYIVWLEYLPVLAWILYDLIKNRYPKAMRLNTD